jgi:UDP-glucose:(heptosyl)LPS alpha-1,3-glucosyltransferase
VRIALVVHDFSRRFGHGRYTVELANRFSRDHEVHIFANTADPDDSGSLRIHHVPAVRSNALTTILSFPLPATVRVGSGWDIVHAQGLTSARFNVITAHICNAGWAQAQRASNVARTWRQRTFEQVVTTLERVTYRRSRAAEVIAISDQLRGELAEFYGRTERVTVIHHGVDTTLFQPTGPEVRKRIRREMSLPARDVIALFVGDLRKGGTVAMHSLSQVPDVHLLVVSGSDTGPYRAYAHSLGVADRVTFHPATRQIQRYYAAADLFLFPSPYDAFGMVVSEAMASGLPVITSRQVGASELIRDGVNGFIVSRADDAAGFAAHVSRVGRDAGLRASIGKAASESVARHTWDDVAQRTMQVYERALARR